MIREIEIVNHDNETIKASIRDEDGIGHVDSRGFCRRGILIESWPRYPSSDGNNPVEMSAGMARALAVYFNEAADVIDEWNADVDRQLAEDSK